MTFRRDVRGAVLFEVLVGLFVLSVSGSLLVIHASAIVDAQRTVLAREAETTGAAQVMAETALLTREELNTRLGRRTSGNFHVIVDRPEPSLFRVSVSRADGDGGEILATLLHRPEPDQ